MSRNPMSRSQPRPSGFIADENVGRNVTRAGLGPNDPTALNQCPQCREMHDRLACRVFNGGGGGWGKRKFHFPPGAFPLKA